MEKITQHFIRLLISFLPIFCIFSPGKKGRTMQFQIFCLWSVTIKFTFVGPSNLDFRSFWLLGLVGLTSPLEPPLGIWVPCLPLRIQICCCIKATSTSSLRAGLRAIGIYSYFFCVTCFYLYFLHFNYSIKTSFEYFPPVSFDSSFCVVHLSQAELLLSLQ